MRTEDQPQCGWQSDINRISNKFIINFGATEIDTDGVARIIFPCAFTSYNYRAFAIHLSHATTTPKAICTYADYKTVTGCPFIVEGGKDSTGYWIDWIAIGY